MNAVTTLILHGIFAGLAAAQSSYEACLATVNHTVLSTGECVCLPPTNQIAAPSDPSPCLAGGYLPVLLNVIDRAAVVNNILLGTSFGQGWMSLWQASGAAQPKDGWEWAYNNGHRVPLSSADLAVARLTDDGGSSGPGTESGVQDCGTVYPLYPNYLNDGPCAGHSLIAYLCSYKQAQPPPDPAAAKERQCSETAGVKICAVYF